MFKVGDVVLYGLQGICKINGIEAKQIGKTALDYYVLSPVFNQNTALFVPMNNEGLVSKMKCILSKKEALELIKNAPQTETIAVKDESTRRELYREILSSGDRAKLLSLIKTIRVEREERSKNGKKLNMSDEQTLYKAEQILFNELAFVLGIDQVQARDKIEF